MVGDVLTTINWQEKGDLVVKQMRHVPSSFNKPDVEEEKYFLSVDKMIEVIDNNLAEIESWDEKTIPFLKKDGMIAQANLFRTAILALKDGKEW